MEEFKIGDYFKILTTTKYNYTQGNIYKIYNIELKNFEGNIFDRIIFIDDSGYLDGIYIKEDLVAKALPHEIPNFEIQYEIC